jgi:hypothetical protein
MIGWQVNNDEQTRTNIHALSWILTHGLSIQAIKACASDHAATGTGLSSGSPQKVMITGEDTHEDLYKATNILFYNICNIPTNSSCGKDDDLWV